MEQPRTRSVPPSDGLRLLAVHAHPDDESSKGAAMMAAYAHAGAEVMVATCTGGERGDILNAAVGSLARAHRDLAGLRREEMAEAAQILGIRHRWLGFVDSGLPEGEPMPPLPYGCFAVQPLERAAEPLVRLVREFRPHVVISYDENGGYPHPDHIQAHLVAVEAFGAAGDPERYPGAGPAWAPRKLYYDHSFNPQRFRALHHAMEEAGLESPYAERVRAWEENPGTEMFGWASPHETTTRIECAEFFGHRDRALLAHRTQIDPDGFFFKVPTELAARHWPWEDYTLVESAVETSLPESDLFAGLR
ncbi:mycothiol conjugate amidase Mca [Arthrobacter ginkgonis]|uniref:Mycothiol S-conjugate amidase n=1 Tax=Arthrobacter ginkgonis TaxID=1630594 RepID=A0ABP7DEX7_9MICC